MADVSNELMVEILRSMHARFDKMETAHRELRADLSSQRGTLVAIASDIHEIRGVLASHDDRLDRIERRLELRELAEAQAVFQHQT